jgi:AICAR transformylase/IMP cyclohydrolase PurH
MILHWRHLQVAQDNGVAAVEVADYTGFRVMDDRVKTLQIHGAAFLAVAPSTARSSDDTASGNRPEWR